MTLDQTLLRGSQQAPEPQEMTVETPTAQRATTLQPVGQYPDRTLDEQTARRVIEMATLYNERKNGHIDQVVKSVQGLDLTGVRRMLSDIGIDKESIERAIEDYAPSEKKVRETFEELGGMYDTAAANRKYAGMVLTALRELYPLDEFRISIEQNDATRKFELVTRKSIVHKPGWLRRLFGQNTPIVREKIAKTLIGKTLLDSFCTEINIHHLCFAKAIEQTQADLDHFEQREKSRHYTKRKIVYHI